MMHGSTVTRGGALRSNEGPSRVLVLGGGLLGGHTAAALSRLGPEVTIVSRSFNPWLLESLDGAAAGVELVEAAIEPSEPLLARIDDADVVVFLAGASTPAHADRHLTDSTADSVLTALSVLDMMRRTSTRRIVLASSGGTVYGEPRSLPTDESHPLDPISIHGLNSVVSERYAEFFARRHGLQVSILRYSNVYGPGQTGRRGQGVIAAWCRAFALGEPITVYGDLGVRRDFVFVEDAARATASVVLAPDALGAYNVGSGEGVRLQTVLDLVAAATGTSVEVCSKPSRGLDVSATALDCTRLRRATGWVPVTGLEDGIVRSWRWTHRQLSPASDAAAPARGQTD